MGDLRNRFFAVAVALVLVLSACSDPEDPPGTAAANTETATEAAGTPEPTEPPTQAPVDPTAEPTGATVETPAEPEATAMPTATTAPEDLPTGPPPGAEPTEVVAAATPTPATPTPSTATPAPTAAPEPTTAPTAAPSATEVPATSTPVPAGPALTIGDRALKETDMSRGWITLGDNPSYEPPQTGEPSDCDAYNQADSVQDFFEYETSLASDDGSGFVTQHLGFTDDPSGADALIAAGSDVASQCDIINEPTGQSQALDFPLPADLATTSAAFRQARPDGDTIVIYVREGDYVARLRVDLLSESATTDAEIIEWATNMVGRLSA